MCGGRGTRFDLPGEKPLYELKGRAMVDHVRRALDGSEVEEAHFVVSPNAPETQSYLAEQAVSVIETPGGGYVADLDHALDDVSTPVLSVAADLPLVEADAIDAVVSRHDHGSVTMCVPAELKRLLNLSIDLTFEHDGNELAPAGINIVSDSDLDRTTVTYDIRFAVNVNTRADAVVAERLL